MPLNPNRWRLAAGALALAFLAINAALLSHGGVRFGGDSQGYLDAASTLARGGGIDRYHWDYATFVAALALFRVLGAPAAGPIALQIGLMGLAGIVLYDLGRALWSRGAGLVAAGLTLLNPDALRWNAYVLTDAGYASLLVIAVWAVHRAVGRRPRWYGLAAGIVLLTSLWRPNGRALVPIAVCYWIARTSWPARLRAGLVVTVVGVILLAALAIPAIASPPVGDPSVSLRQGQVLWHQHLWEVRAPPGASGGKPGLVGTIGFAGAHPVFTTEVAASRVGAELLHARPYYSRAHNALLLAFLAPLYVAAGVAIVRSHREPLLLLVLAVVASQMFIVALLWADYDGRFLTHVVPLIGLIAVGSLPRDELSWRRTRP